MTDTQVGQQPQPVAPRNAVPSAPLATAVQLALHAGWTIALLYGHIPQPASDNPKQLPTVHELDSHDRVRLELGRLNHLLEQLAALPDYSGSGLPTNIRDLGSIGSPEYQGKLKRFHTEVLDALATATPETELAYQLGRSIRDTVNPPAGPQDPRAPALASQLARGRIAQIQEWLAALSAHLPPHTAAIVGASMGRWSELAAVTMDTQATALKKARNGGEEQFARDMCAYLLPQGDLWLMLLIGERPTAGLLGPEGYVAAGEATLRRSAKIVRRVLRHFWFLLLLMAATLSGILYLAVTYLGGAAKVWTSIAAIGGSLGISGKSITSAIGRLGAEAERPVFGLEQEDAMAWAITMLPHVGLKSRGVRQLRRADVMPTTSLGNL